MPISLTPMVAQGGSGSNLPQSTVLPLLAQGTGISEADAAKLNEFLQGASNCMVIVQLSPIPDDTQVDHNERKGKKTDKVDNSDKVVSRSNTYARVENFTLPWGDPNVKVPFSFSSYVTDYVKVLADAEEA